MSCVCALTLRDVFEKNVLKSFYNFENFSNLKMFCFIEVLHSGRESF